MTNLIPLSCRLVFSFSEVLNQYRVPQMLSSISCTEILVIPFPSRPYGTVAFFRAMSVRSASYSQPSLYTYKSLLFICLELHFVLLNFIPFLPILFRSPQILCHQAKGNTWLFGRSNTISKCIVPVLYVDNLMPGFHLVSHRASFPCSFTFYPPLFNFLFL